MDKIEMHEVADILNAISQALEGKGFQVSGYDNTGDVLMVIVQRDVFQGNG